MNDSRHPRRLGFSLLEMVVAMFIITLLLGMTMAATRSLLSDEELRSASRQLGLMAKTARQDAMLENRPYEIVLDGDYWLLRPVENEDSGADPKDPKTFAETSKPVDYRLPASIKMKTRLWGSKEWEKPREMAWYFSPLGLCAPNTFRLERGDSWMQMTFNPLTANMQDEEWYLP